MIYSIQEMQYNREMQLENTINTLESERDALQARLDAAEAVLDGITYMDIPAPVPPNPVMDAIIRSVVRQLKRRAAKYLKSRPQA